MPASSPHQAPTVALAHSFAHPCEAPTHTHQDRRPSALRNCVSVSSPHDTQAEALTKAAHPNKTVHVVPENSMVTMDFREDRVRIFVDGEGKVVSAPTLG
jgi:hypothetical protein